MTGNSLPDMPARADPGTREQMLAKKTRFFLKANMVSRITSTGP
jgi:hypothetical protein